MAVSILGRNALRRLVEVNPQEITAIIIHEFGGVEDVKDIYRKCKDYFLVEFDDVVNENPGSPTLDKVREAIEWSKDKEDLVVACAAGISRSSAIAYLIECSKTPPGELNSINILDLDIHFPNELILKYGTMLLPQHRDLNEHCKNIYQQIADKRKWRLTSVTKYFKD